MKQDPLSSFTPQVREWFLRAFAQPTEAQQQAWPAIARGENVLLSAPTGSGKTLAAFLWALDRLVADPVPDGKRRTRLVYVSPLKALSYDIERNLRAPLRGIGGEVTVAIRTGDTPQKERQAMLRTPPDVLITTPESLYLMLTSRAREIFEGVEWVIVDEIHAVAQTKRGAHLALTLERLERQAGARVQRIGLSATQRPLEVVGRFLAGTGRECTVIDTGVRKELDVRIQVPVEDMREPDAGAELDPLAGGENSTRRSIWPAIYPELLDLVEEHRSTIVFVNNRRGAERLALRLNELAAERKAERDGAEPDGGAPPEVAPLEIARAHHGSLAREERLVVEELLKSGELPCLVATSSLELGIDMGAVDLVLQVESPKSVTAGLQRIGRAGHGVGEVSKGRIFPKFRADLLESTVVVKRMREGLIETTVVPRNPLDVLAQQIVAMTAADEEWSVPELHELVKRAHPFAELSRPLLDNVLDMLDGRYPSEAFGDLRPRIVWDRVADVVRPRKGSRQLAVTNAGTIPDRGLFGVHLPDGRRVGELDEEMVYEARPGQVFLLGASSWRIEEITRDRVIVTPAPGAPGAVPFWRGDGVGRPVELGRAVGEFSRWAVDQDPAELVRTHDLDQRAANNLVAYLREQREATRVVPSDRTIVVERFRDEIGDWRICVLSPYGGRVHAAWGLALSARIRDELGLEADAIWSDDGIIVHLPDADEPPPRRVHADRPRRARGPGGARAVVLGAVRGALPRERLARAADPARLPGQAHAALAAAAQGAEPARGGEAVRPVPDRARDLPRVPARRVRPAGGHRHPAQAAIARALARRGRDTARVAVRVVAAVRLRGDLHVRGRHAERRAPRGRPVARSRPSARAAGPGGAARADRPGRPGRGRGRPAAPQRAHAGGERRLAARRPARARRPDERRGADALHRGRLGRPHARPARGRAARGADAHRRRGALARRRGRGPLPRRLRRGAARRAAGGVHRARRGAAGPHRAPLCAHARPVHDRRRAGALLGRPDQRAARARARRQPGARRAAPRRLGARVVRPGGAAPPAARLARLAAQGGRAGRAARPRAAAAVMAGRRLGAAGSSRRGPAARDPRSAPGRGARAGGVGAGRAAAARGRLFRHLARPALRGRRGGLDRRRRARPALRQGCAVLPRRLTLARAAARQGRLAGGAGPRRHPRAARAGGVVLERPAGRRLRAGPGRAAGGAVGPRVGRRGDQRRVRSAAGAAPLAGPRGTRPGTAALRPPPAPGRAADPGALVAHPLALRRRARVRPAHRAPLPRCCSSATA